MSRLSARYRRAKQRYRVAFKLLGDEAEIEFLTRPVLEALHDDMIADFGGLHGVRDPVALESALAAPAQHAAYQDRYTVPQLGAMLASRIVRNHPFLDGNKRTALAGLLAFLEANRYRLAAEPADVFSTFRALAAGTMDERDFIAWAERNSEPFGEHREPEGAPPGLGA